MSIRLALADDHPPILQGLALLLRQEPDFEVLAGCRDGEETLQAVYQLRPDILILDILMPRKDGLAVLRELHQVEIPTRVILLTAAIDEDNLLEAMRLGVGGVVLGDLIRRLRNSERRHRSSPPLRPLPSHSPQSTR